MRRRISSLTPFCPDKALETVNNIDAGDVPSYLKSPYIGYLYPHDYKNHYVKQQYLPDDVKDAHYYIYGSNKFEQALKEYWDKIKK